MTGISNGDQVLSGHVVTRKSLQEKAAEVAKRYAALKNEEDAADGEGDASSADALEADSEQDLEEQKEMLEDLSKQEEIRACKDEGVARKEREEKELNEKKESEEKSFKGDALLRAMETKNSLENIGLECRISESGDEVKLKVERPGTSVEAMECKLVSGQDKSHGAEINFSK